MATKRSRQAERMRAAVRARSGSRDEIRVRGIVDEAAVHAAAGEPEAGAASADAGGVSVVAAPAPAAEQAADVKDAASEPAAEPEGYSEESVGRSASLMSGLVIISRITGFFRTWCQAFALGATVMASCYTVAITLPNQLYELVMGGMLITAFLPVYLSVKKRAGREGANAYVSNLVSLVVLVMGVVAVLSFVFAAQIVWTQSFSASSEFDTGLAIYFFRFFACEVVLYALSSIFSGILNAERNYFWSTAAPILNNVIASASFLVYALVARTHPTEAVLVLAIGNPLGVLVQVLCQIPGLRSRGVRISPRIDIHDPLLRETLSIGIPSLVVTFTSFITVAVQTSSSLMATPVGASVTYYSRMWYMLPYSVFAIPISTAMFTELADCVAKGDIRSYVRGIQSGTGKILFMLVPFAMYLIAFSPELTTILAAGRFTGDQVTMTIGYLSTLSLALPFYGICMYLQKACSSIRRMGIYAVSSVIAAVIQVAICLVCTPIWGLNVVAASSLFFFLAVDVVTFVALRREVGHIGLRSIAVSGVRSVVLGAAGAAVGLAILWVLTRVAPLSGSMLQALLYCVLGGVPAMAVTFGIAVAKDLSEASFVAGIVRRFLPARRAS